MVNVRVGGHAETDGPSRARSSCWSRRQSTSHGRPAAGRAPLTISRPLRVARGRRHARRMIRLVLVASVVGILSSLCAESRAHAGCDNPAIGAGLQIHWSGKERSNDPSGAVFTPVTRQEKTDQAENRHRSLGRIRGRLADDPAGLPSTNHNRIDLRPALRAAGAVSVLEANRH